MKSITRTARTVLTVAAFTLVVSTAADARGHGREIQYSVTVTNSTKAVQFTPIAAATHNRGIALFELGEPASTPLADVAESGDISALAAVLEDSSAVANISSTEGLLEAGKSTTFTITTTRGNGLFSMAAMLLPTNDAYDAGSEPNDEVCANIPGPFCGGEGRSADDSNAEGFVHMANGIHGIADVPAQTYDWRGAVADGILYVCKTAFKNNTLSPIAITTKDTGQCFLTTLNIPYAACCITAPSCVVEPMYCAITIPDIALLLSIQK